MRACVIMFELVLFWHEG